MKLRDEYLQDVDTILVKNYRDGYVDGAAEGYRAAERIMVWWLSNRTLKEPHAVETLEEWSRAELAKLKAKFAAT